MFCMRLFNFVNYVFLLLYLCILIIYVLFCFIVLLLQLTNISYHITFRLGVMRIVVVVLSAFKQRRYGV